MTPSRNEVLGLSALTSVVLLAAALWTQSRYGQSLLPHAFCITGSQPLLWLHLVSDGLIAFAYLLIPWAILNFVRRRPDIPFGWIAWLFGAFIVACGVTHALEVWTLWEPVYWYAGVMKAFTAAVSLATAWVIYRLTPAALALPSRAQLQAANRQLEQEVAARRTAEAELRVAQAELERLVAQNRARADQADAVLDRFFDHAPAGLVVLDDDLRFQRVNPGLELATGRPVSDFLGRRLDDIPDLPQPVRDTVASVVRTGEAQVGVEVSRVVPDGLARHWRISYFPIGGGPGRLGGLGGIVQDITYQREVEREREAALAAAERANRAKDQFLARVSHELRSPLQVAVSSAEVLRRLPGMPERAQPFVGRLLHAVDMQGRMINDLLDISRVLSGKLHVDLDVIDPVPPLLHAVEQASGAARGRGITVDATAVAAGAAQVAVDPARIEQVYANLLDNAVRFSPDGAVISVATDVEDGRWHLRVADQGPGLTPDEARDVFEPFVQAANQPKTGKGLGLGLAIVRSLTDAFGGHVRAESPGPGQGCTFHLELPLAAAPAAPGSPGSAAAPAPAPAPASAAVPRLDGVRILYVEDAVDVARAMQSGLAEAGAEVRVAHDHAAAMAWLERERFDVLVTDLDLGPGPSGHAVVRGAHRSAAHAEIPAVAVSAFGTAEDREATRAAGFRAHLVKPVRVAQLAAALQGVLGGA